MFQNIIYSFFSLYFILKFYVVLESIYVQYQEMLLILPIKTGMNKYFV